MSYSRKISKELSIVIAPGVMALNTLEDMAEGAKHKGYEYLVISDHSKAAFYANGLNEERIAAQHVEIDAPE